MVNGYAPTNTEATSISAKETFYKDLEAACKTGHRQLLLAGDMNATSNFGSRFLGGNNCTVTEANDNGRRVEEFANQHRLAIMNTWFAHKKVHRDTWYHANENLSFSKCVDYIFMSPWLSTMCRDVRVRTSFFSSDHRLLVARMATPHRRCDFPQFVKKKSAKRRNFEPLRSKSDPARQKFVTKVDELAQQIMNDNSSVEDCTKLVELLNSAAEKTLPVQSSNSVRRIWEEDSTLIELKKKKLEVDRVKNRTDFNTLTRKIRRQYDVLRNRFYAEQAKELNELVEKREIEKLYQAVMASEIVNKKVPEKECAGLREFFETHFNKKNDAPKPDTIINPPDFIRKVIATGVVDDAERERMAAAPRTAEIERIIGKMKNKRAFTDVPSEFLKAASESSKFVELVRKMLETVWNEMKIPELWRRTSVTPLYKQKGSRNEWLLFPKLQIQILKCAL